VISAISKKENKGIGIIYELEGKLIASGERVRIDACRCNRSEIRRDQL